MSAWGEPHEGTHTLPNGRQFEYRAVGHYTDDSPAAGAKPEFVLVVDASPLPTKDELQELQSALLAQSLTSC